MHGICVYVVHVVASWSSVLRGLIMLFGVCYILHMSSSILAIMLHRSPMISGYVVCVFPICRCIFVFDLWHAVVHVLSSI